MRRRSAAGEEFALAARRTVPPALSPPPLAEWHALSPSLAHSTAGPRAPAPRRASSLCPAAAGARLRGRDPFPRVGAAMSAEARRKLASPTAAGEPARVAEGEPAPSARRGTAGARGPRAWHLRAPAPRWDAATEGARLSPSSAPARTCGARWVPRRDAMPARAGASARGCPPSAHLRGLGISRVRPGARARVPWPVDRRETRRPVRGRVDVPARRRPSREMARARPVLPVARGGCARGGAARPCCATHREPLASAQWPRRRVALRLPPRRQGRPPRPGGILPSGGKSQRWRRVARAPPREPSGGSAGPSAHRPWAAAPRAPRRRCGAGRASPALRQRGQNHPVRRLVQRWVAGRADARELRAWQVAEEFPR